MSNATSKAAIVEKARSLYEGREAIYCEHGVLRVRVNRVYIGSCRVTKYVSEYMAYDLEEIPTQGFPVWLVPMGQSLGPHPLRLTIGTNLESHLYPDYLNSYVGWSLHFAPALVAEIVEIATDFPGDDSLALYSKIGEHILNETVMKLLKPKSSPST